MYYKIIPYFLALIFMNFLIMETAIAASKDCSDPTFVRCTSSNAPNCNRVCLLNKTTETRKSQVAFTDEFNTTTNYRANTVSCPASYTVSSVRYLGGATTAATVKPTTKEQRLDYEQKQWNCYRNTSVEQCYNTTTSGDVGTEVEIPNMNSIMYVTKATLVNSRSSVSGAKEYCCYLSDCDDIAGAGCVKDDCNSTQRRLGFKTCWAIHNLCGQEVSCTPPSSPPAPDGGSGSESAIRITCTWNGQQWKAGTTPTLPSNCTAPTGRASSSSAVCPQPLKPMNFLPVSDNPSF